MNTNIEMNTIMNYFLLDNQNGCQNIKKNINQKYKTKIINECFLSINEANISDIIKQIPYYSKYYLPIENYNYIDIRQFNEEIAYLDKTDIKDNKYLLVIRSNPRVRARKSSNKKVFFELKNSVKFFAFLISKISL
jgi:hypothetical protein